MELPAAPGLGSERADAGRRRAGEDGGPQSIDAGDPQAEGAVARRRGEGRLVGGAHEMEGLALQGEHAVGFVGRQEGELEAQVAGL